MLSETMDISDFLKRVDGMDFNEIVWLADREATDAQRLVLKGRRQDANRLAAADCYAGQLVDMIQYLRYGARPTGLHRRALEACNTLKMQQ